MGGEQVREFMSKHFLIAGSGGDDNRVCPWQRRFQAFQDALAQLPQSGKKMRNFRTPAARKSLPGLATVGQMAM
jgi:hypothetical protein